MREPHRFEGDECGGCGMHVCEKPDLAAGEEGVRTEDAHYGVPVVAAGVAGEEGVV